MTDTVESLNDKINAIKTSIEYQTLIVKHRGPLDERRLRELNLRINAFENQKKALVQPQELARGLASLQRGAKILAAPKISTGSVIKAKTKEEKVGRREEERKMPQPYRHDVPPPAPANVGYQPPAVQNITPFQPPKKRDAQHPFKVAVPVPPLGAHPSGPGVLGGAGGKRIGQLAAVKQKAPLAQQKGMAPPPAPEPAVKTTGKYSTVNKSGRPQSRGATKAVPGRVPPRPTAASITAPPKAFVPQGVLAKAAAKPMAKQPVGRQQPHPKANDEEMDDLPVREEYNPILDNIEDVDLNEDDMADLEETEEI
jgi:hypothetical protein